MEYRKERNFIVAYDGEKMRGKWDILTNTYIGIKGNPISSIPTAFSRKTIEANMPPYLHHAITLASTYGKTMPYTQDRSSRLEEIISVGLTIKCSYVEWNSLLTEHTPLTKDVVQFIKDNHDGIYSVRWIQEYQLLKKYNNFFSNITDNKIRLWAINIFENIDTELPQEWVCKMIMRAIHEKIYYSYSSLQFSCVLNEWYSAANILGEELEVKHNILTNHQILKWLVNEYKQEHYNERLTAYNNQPWLYFETDDMFAYPLLTTEDFHTEATEQRNCVERMYMEQVFMGKTHIVAVRKKDDIDKPYITCEVSNDGQIIQYLYKYNQPVYNEHDLKFRTLYNMHLDSSLAK